MRISLKNVILHYFAECQCNLDGTTYPAICQKDTGKCLCKPHWTGDKCDSTGEPNIVFKICAKKVGALTKKIRFGQYAGHPEQQEVHP